MKHAIHCETEEEARAVLQIAHDAGLKWAEGAQLTKNSYWYVDETDTCYNLSSERTPGCVLQGTIHEYTADGYTIVKAQDFIEADRRRKVMKKVDKIILDSITESLLGDINEQP